jgi:hypothetical protein
MPDPTKEVCMPDPIEIKEPDHESITIVSTRLRMSIPASFSSRPLADRLVRMVQQELDASDAVVHRLSFNNDSMAIDFTLPNTLPDQVNLRAIRNMVEDLIPQTKAYR